MQCNFIKRSIFCSNSACFTVSFPSKPVRFCYSYDVSNTSILILELKNPGLNISLKKIKSVISQKLISPSDIEQMILYVGSVFEKQEDMCSNRWAILILSKHSKASIFEQTNKVKRKQDFFVGIVSAFHCWPTDLITGQLTYICANFCSP